MLNIEIIKCPNCMEAMLHQEDRLTCCKCGSEFDVVDGLYYLYPNDMDMEHLNEEILLSKKMCVKEKNDKELFVEKQWAQSKKEFWDMVKKNVFSNDQYILYVGCGFDDGFKNFSDDKVFINFDIVPDMLKSLMKKGAKYCVAGDINKMPFRNSSFDCIIIVDVIHHEYERIYDIIASFTGLLKSGGKIFIEDPNAWGLNQFYKSKILPKNIYRTLRKKYHSIKKSTHRPADYEYPTDVWVMKHILERLGYKEINVCDNYAYPNVGKMFYGFYKMLSGISRVRKYHNFHYMINAKIY